MDRDFASAIIGKAVGDAILIVIAVGLFFCAVSFVAGYATANHVRTKWIQNKAVRDGLAEWGVNQKTGELELIFNDSDLSWIDDETDPI